MKNQKLLCSGCRAFSRAQRYRHFPLLHVDAEAFRYGRRQFGGCFGGNEASHFIGGDDGRFRSVLRHFVPCGCYSGAWRDTATHHRCGGNVSENGQLDETAMDDQTPSSFHAVDGSFADDVILSVSFLLEFSHSPRE